MGSAVDQDAKAAGRPEYLSDDLPATITVEKGGFILMAGGRWFRCTDINMPLSRQVTRIGIALVGFQYDEGVGAENRLVASFTVRQNYQARRPSLDYTHAWLAKWLGGIKQYQGEERRKAVVEALNGPLALFEREYKNFQAEHEEMAGSGLLSV